MDDSKLDLWPLASCIHKSKQMLMPKKFCQGFPEIQLKKNNPSATANADTGIKKYAWLLLQTVCVILQTTSGQTTHTQPNKTNWEWMGKLSGKRCGCCTKEFYAFVKHQFAN